MEVEVYKKSDCWGWRVIGAPKRYLSYGSYMAKEQGTAFTKKGAIRRGCRHKKRFETIAEWKQRDIRLELETKERITCDSKY